MKLFRRGGKEATYLIPFEMRRPLWVLRRYRAQAILGLFGCCGATGLSFSQWKAGVSDDEANAERINTALQRLPSLQDAQRTRVKRIPKFLCSDEVDQLEKEILSLQRFCGQAMRDAHGVKMLRHTAWRTTYLHSDDLFRTKMPSFIDKVLTAAVNVDRAEGWGLLTGVVQPRTIEFHEALRGGGLAQSDHFDGGSCVTVDIMLSDTAGFSGGEFCTLEVDGSLQPHVFERGDMLVFVSHKFHMVDRIRSGERRVFVIEFWEGDRRTCGHRCLKRFGECGYTPRSAAISAILHNLGSDL